jgi:(4S)-4-hydroxy-5-phosphonooxypentane-2,3-dione isomerase
VWTWPSDGTALDARRHRGGILRPMFDVAWRMVAVPGSEDEIWEALQACAAASREEPGVAWFEAFRSDREPRHVLVVERYESEAAYAEHRTTPHYAAWKAASAGKIEDGEKYVGRTS